MLAETMKYLNAALFGNLIVIILIIACHISHFDSLYDAYIVYLYAFHYHFFRFLLWDEQTRCLMFYVVDSRYFWSKQVIFHYVKNHFVIRNVLNSVNRHFNNLCKHDCCTPPEWMND